MEVATPTASLLEPHRRELVGYCYRMLGSLAEAEDAVQETFLRAWQALTTFEGRASIRTWLHRIATNVCLDVLKGSARRVRPMDLSGPGAPEDFVDARLPGTTWVFPVPDARVTPGDADPAAQLLARESVRLAFVAALQHLPPRQRAVLILREVLGASAAEAAEVLDTSVASVNSALQRARATLDALPADRAEAFSPLDAVQQALLGRYLDAFQRYDLDELTALFHEDATISMPPYPLWLQGHEDMRVWLGGPGAACRGSRLVPIVASGMPAFGQYRRAPDGGHAAWALQLLDVRDGRVAGLCSFLDVAELFPMYGLPLVLPEGAPTPAV